ncbi:MAG: DUF2905 domain-containing protein [bacterium]|nr:DUF2905 domain-containing protein [bacterium]
MRSLAIGLMVLGAALAAAGALVWLAWRFHIPLGRLPGDFHWQGKGWSVAIPLATCIILSLLLTLLLNLFARR